jgi:hypothetical protein
MMYLIFQEVFRWWQLHQMTDVLDQWSGKKVPTVSRWWKLCQLAAVVSTAISYFTDNIYQGKNFSSSWHEHSLNLWLNNLCLEVQYITRQAT